MTASVSDAFSAAWYFWSRAEMASSLAVMDWFPFVGGDSGPGRAAASAPLRRRRPPRPGSGRDQVPVDDDVRAPGRAGVELRAGQAQAVLEEPRRVAREGRLGLLLVGEAGQLAALEQPPPVGPVRAQEAGGAVADGGDDLAGVVEHRGEERADGRIDGEILHGAVPADDEDDVEGSGPHVLQPRRRPEETPLLLEVSLLAGHLAGVVAVVTEGEAELVHHRGDAGRGADGDLQPRRREL